MGLTPMEGLVMGTRSGDVDPGLLGYLAERTGQTVGELTEALDTRSGLLGLSGWSNDMRTVQTAAAQGDERAQLALDVFVHRLAKAIAGMFTSLAAARRTLVFAGGIGENCTLVRGLVLAGWGRGLAEDPGQCRAGVRARDGSPPGLIQPFWATGRS